MPDAHVTNVAVLDDFRADLVQFSASVRQALADLDLEIRRALDWISSDRAAYWRTEVRRSQDAVAQAKDELAKAKTFKRIDDYVPACIEEKKQLEKAKRRLEHAEKKVEAVRHWSRAAPRAADEFRGHVQQLVTLLDGDITKAIALLERMGLSLERYTNMGTPAAVKWEELVGEVSGISMARPAEEGTKPPAAAAEGAET